MDSLKTLPFLFIACVLIEYISHKNIINTVMKQGKLGPVIGSVVGCIPQCGFSVIAARLYSVGVITTGTLLSVFVATSDEAFSILAIHPELYQTLLLLIGVKIVAGLVSGLLVDSYNHHQDDDYNFYQMSHEDLEEGNFLVEGLKHTIKIFVFILLTNLILTFIINTIGETNLSNFLDANKYLQPIVAGLVGFIPNCAGSVILTQLYVNGGLSLGALLCGLTTSAGVGTLALITYNKDKKDSLRILALSYLVALVLGYIFTIF
jgi:hypothetical protein